LKNSQILSILDDLERLETLTDKQRLYLSHQYSSYQQGAKAIALMKTLYQNDPRPEYKERLVYLRNQENTPEKADSRSVEKVKPAYMPASKTVRKQLPSRSDRIRTETQMAYDLIHQKKYDEAVIHLKNVLKYEPNNAVRHEQLAQAYYAQEKYALAAEAFEKAASLNPKSGYYESLGYCHIKLEDKQSAIKNFKKSIDIVTQEEPENIDKLYQLKYSVAELDRNFFGYLTYGMRLDSYNNTGAISPILSANYGGFSALELHYKPEVFDDYATAYVKVLSGVRDQSLALESETWQPSIGLRFQPLKEERLYFFIEQFFKGGDESRDDTMLRASWEHFDGYNFYPTKTEYSWKHLYMDSVYYLDNGTYSLYANYEHGYVWKSGYEDAWMPYLCTSVGYSNDNSIKETIKRFDVGAGISYLFWRNEREYKSHQYIGRTRLEYRHQYAGDPEDDHALRLMLEFFF
jgi:tetratricopeptide (TPR) repeat protein